MAKYLLITESNNDNSETEHLTIRILSSTSHELNNGPSEVVEILNINDGGFKGHRTLVQVNGKGTFFIWTQKVSGVSSWTLEQAHTHIEHHLRQATSEATIVMFSRDDLADEKPAQRITLMVSVLSLGAESAKSAYLDYQDRLALEEISAQGINLRSRRERNCIQRNRAFIMVALMLLAMGVMMTATSVIGRSTPNNDAWMTWTLPKDSKGFMNQLQFTWPHPNFTSWSAKTNYNADDFFVRLDDQSMVPSKYVDDYELEYQAWFAKRYPVLAEISASQSYLNESYWRDSRSYPVAINHEFHVAHCVLVMKRYWHNRESGGRVCPRDIEHNHINHCFGVLETYAMHDFNTTHRMDPQVNGTSMMWIVNACF